MTTFESASLIFSIAAFLFVLCLVAIDQWKQWRIRRAERRAIEEHTDEFWRQVG